MPMSPLSDIRQHILYEDPSILVIHKPAGLAVQSKSVMDPDLETLLRTYLGTPFLGIVQRLDQPVEGLLVFAKTKKAASSLGNQMRSREFTKQYRAVVSPKETAKPLVVSGQMHELCDCLKKDPRSNISQVVPAGTPGAKEAQLSYQVLALSHDEERGLNLALLSVLLGTGRHHQIRVQLSHAGYPLLGDTRYGGPACQGLALCSTYLSFTHPLTGKEMSFSISPEGPAFALFS